MREKPYAPFPTRGLRGVSDGLKKGKILGFTLAGKDGKYYPARAAAVASDRVEAVSPDVKEPCMLTYAFMQYQDFCNGRATDGAPLRPSVPSMKA